MLPGEVFGLLGPNGAGKTTLIRVGLDILRADEGEVMLFGKTPEEAARSPMPKMLGAGFEQSIDMVAAALGFDLDREKRSEHRMAVATAPIASPIGPIQPGRVAALGYLPRPENAPPAAGEARVTRSRDVFFDGTARETRIVDRQGLEAGDVLDGPAIIEESTATTLLPPGWQATVIDGGHLTLSKGGTT